MTITAAAKLDSKKIYTEKEKGLLTQLEQKRLITTQNLIRLYNFQKRFQKQYERERNPKERQRICEESKKIKDDIFQHRMELEKNNKEITDFLLYH